ncbi:MAG: Ig-like domain-containing protein, partial [Lachnospiraceae bacterium]|nr:Ig-like domain-containing protein [Lachnospiraceae bacterium]
MKKVNKYKIAVSIMTLIFICLLSVGVNAKTNIKLNKVKATMYVGSSMNLKLTGNNKKVNWSSSNKKIASVSSKGKVSAKKAGKATITATSNKKKYKCKITVKNPYLSKTKLTITGRKTYTLKLIGTTVKSWVSLDKKIATVNSKGKITTKKAGTTVIICTGKNGKKYKCTLVVKHEFEELKVEPGCTEKGYILHKCINCDYSYKDNYMDETGHSFVSEVTKEATCIEEGIRTYRCSKCEENYTEPVQATGHKIKETTVEPGCDEKGYILHKCINCDYGYKDNYMDEKGHDFIAEITKEATCIEEGIRTYRCSRCEVNHTEPLPPTGHGFVENVVEATCTEEGYTEHKCKYCNYSYKDNYTNKLGHDLVSETIEEGSCIKDGVKKYTCTRCGEEHTEPVLATGHDFVENVVDATCTEDGYSFHKCNNCEYGYKDNYTDKLGHEHIAGICSRCGDLVPGMYDSEGNLSLTWEEILSKGYFK